MPVLQQLGSRTFRQVREDLRSFIDLGGLTLPAATSPWAGAFAADTITTPDGAAATLAAVQNLASHTLPETISRLQ